MANNIYIGNRYVPIFANPVEWDNLRSYEPLTIVTYQGTAYTSKKTVPAGTALSNTEYWVVTGNYNAQVEQYRQEVVALSNTVDDMKDGSISGSLQNQISTLDLELNGISDRVSENESDLSRIKNRKFLFIGDSYMTGENGTGTNTVSFAIYFGNYAGLTANTDYWVSAHSGYGFDGSNFETLLSNTLANLTIEQKASITDVVALGGINDSTIIGSNLTQFESYMASFVSTAKTNLPNATVRVGYISKDYVGRFNLNKKGISAYKLINRNGGVYLNGVENILRDLSHFVSDGHPSEEGQRTLGRYLVDALYGGNAEPSYAPSAVHVVPESGITIDVNEIIAEASNGQVTISAHNWSIFKFASRSFTSPTDPLYVGAIDQGLVIGESDSYKYIPITLIVLCTGGPLQIEGKLLFQNKGLYIFPWQQLQVISGCTELRIAPFSHTLNTASI